MVRARTFGTRFLSRWRWKTRAAIAVACAGILYLLYLWPARRNYKGNLKYAEYRPDIPYIAGDADPKRKLDLYLPRGATKPFPVVVFLHGGFWSPLDRRWLQPLLGTFGNVGAAFARRGIAAAIVGYRQYPQIRNGDDSFDDVAKAIRFVRDSCPDWGCDRDRIFVIGHSAGGYMTALLALDPRVLRRNGVNPDALGGFVSIDGIFDLKASLAYFKPKEADVLVELFGPDDEALAAHSPILYAHADHPPLLFIDSKDDEKVCTDGFYQMKQAMRLSWDASPFVELPGLGHNETVIRVGMDDDRVLPAITEFLGLDSADTHPNRAIDQAAALAIALRAIKVEEPPPWASDPLNFVAPKGRLGLKEVARSKFMLTWHFSFKNTGVHFGSADINAETGEIVRLDDGVVHR